MHMDICPDMCTGIRTDMCTDIRVGVSWKAWSTHMPVTHFSKHVFAHLHSTCSICVYMSHMRSVLAAHMSMHRCLGDGVVRECLFTCLNSRLCACRPTLSIRVSTHGSTCISMYMPACIPIHMPNTRLHSCLCTCLCTCPHTGSCRWPTLRPSRRLH